MNFKLPHNTIALVTVYWFTVNKQFIQTWKPTKMNMTKLTQWHHSFSMFEYRKSLAKDYIYIHITHRDNGLYNSFRYYNQLNTIQDSRFPHYDIAYKNQCERFSHRQTYRKTFGICFLSGFSWSKNLLPARQVYVNRNTYNIIVLSLNILVQVYVRYN